MADDPIFVMFDELAVGYAGRGAELADDDE
jgi:hypothetical protein